MYKYVLIVSI